MKRTIPYIILCTLAVCTFSCRPLGDELLSYGQNDMQAFYDANQSFSGEFKAFWTAMNENYGIWDYEESFGTDWDEVYTTYLPKFEALDSLKNVPDSVLRKLYEQITDTLHDGHLSISIKNLHSGKYINLDPQGNRVQRERAQEWLDLSQEQTDLHFYRATTSGPYRVKKYDGANSTTIVLAMIDTMLTRVVTAADNYIALVDGAGGPDQTNDSLYAYVPLLKSDAQYVQSIIHSASSAVLFLWKDIVINNYEKIYTNYAFVAKQIGAPLRPIDKNMNEDILGGVEFAFFEGNIAYLRLVRFGLVLHLDPAYQSHDSASTYFAYQESVKRVWQSWFDSIQVHHKAGDLGGVIIDVRNNSGGAVNDYQWVAGALMKSGGYASHIMRTKNGTGRLDYGPLTQFIVPTYPGEHAVVEKQPIVVLANCKSISMAENTTWGIKSLPNGCFIGTRTFGALSALQPNPEYYSDNYSGVFGVQNVTPIYGYVPKFICLYADSSTGTARPVEGVGFSPDIECPWDIKLWKNTGRDNQLEKAIDYINTKK